jgi:predicted Fe-Mo cluster-binding NifX family protein
VKISFDELEALRLLHVEGATQAEAGRRLGVSGSTVSRIADRAHRVITEALIGNKALCVEGGPVTVVKVSESGSTGEPDASRQPGDGNDSMDQGERMIVAVPYLQGNINAHFGSTRAFMVAETADGKVSKAVVYEIQGMQHNHAGIAGFLKEQGVNVIIAGGMGPPMQQALKMQGFDLYCGVQGPAVAAVEAFLRGEIEQSESTCGHHSGEHEHEH